VILFAAAVVASLLFGTDVAVAPDVAAPGWSAAITDVSGTVFVRRAGEKQFALANVGEVFFAGDVIWTARGTAELTYFEGSSVRIESERQLTVAPLRVARDAGLVGIAQTVVRTWDAVARLFGGSREEMKTPTSSATVRG
jgi:hypothetical protein